jgi:hypothetical protein
MGSDGKCDYRCHGLEGSNPLPERRRTQRELGEATQLDGRIFRRFGKLPILGRLIP